MLLMSYPIEDSALCIGGGDLMTLRLLGSIGKKELDAVAGSIGSFHLSRRPDSFHSQKLFRSSSRRALVSYKD